MTLQRIAQAGEKLQSAGSTVENIGKKMSVISAGVTAMGMASAKMAVDFEDEMAKASTIADTSEVAEAADGGLNRRRRSPWITSTRKRWG